MSIASPTIETLRAAALRQPGAHERASGMIKFQCPACAAEGHDEHRDNAVLFLDTGKWGCAYAVEADQGRAHRKAIGEALGAFQQFGTSGCATVWATAVAVPAFLEEDDAAVDFIEPRLLVRGAITELYSPRGLGKTQVTYAIAVRQSRAGRRVLLVDRDNPRHEIRRRLKKWGGHDAAHFKLITRDKAPALTDAAAWSAFPLDTYDVVIVDSIDASTEGVGEGDSAKPSVAFAAVLDLARRADGPAILVLGNVVKSGAHSRGSGVLEDRGDIVYEIRDATDLKPSGQKDWWHELAPAGSRRLGRPRVPTQAARRLPPGVHPEQVPAGRGARAFRAGDRPPRRAVDAAGRDRGPRRSGPRGADHRHPRARGDDAPRPPVSCSARCGAGPTSESPPLTTGEAEALLHAAGLTQKAARQLVKARAEEGPGRQWHLSPGPRPGGERRRRCLPDFLSRDPL